VSLLVHNIYSIPSEVWLYYESMFHLAYVLCGPVRAGAVHKVVSISDQLSWLSTGFLGSLRLRIPDRTRPTTTAAYARCAQTQMHWHSYTPTSIQYFQLTWNIFAKNVSFPLPWKQGGEGGVGWEICGGNKSIVLQSSVQILMVLNCRAPRSNSICS